jgi:hypothetical protein
VKPIVCAVLAAACLSVLAGPAVAQGNNANPNAPGQDKTCLVTTTVPDNFDNVNVDAQWLPRKAAKAQADKDPTMKRIYDYTKENEPLLANNTYASAEELCNELFD